MIEANVTPMRNRAADLKSKTQRVAQILDHYIITANTVTLTGAQKLAALSVLDAAMAELDTAHTSVEAAFNAANPVE